jgi:hypothetical protein
MTRASYRSSRAASMRYGSCSGVNAHCLSLRCHLTGLVLSTGLRSIISSAMPLEDTAQQIPNGLPSAVALDDRQRLPDVDRLDVD